MLLLSFWFYFCYFWELDIVYLDIYCVILSLMKDVRRLFRLNLAVIVLSSLFFQSRESSWISWKFYFTQSFWTYSLLFQIQQNKQAISNLKRKHSDSIEDLRPANDNSSRVNARWTNEELLLAVQGVRKYGKDFKSIAEVLGNKTEHHVRTFFVNYRKRYSLDNILKEYEKDHGPIVEDANEEKMEIDDGNNDNNSDVICLSPTLPSAKKEFKNNKIATAQGSKWWFRPYKY